MSLPQPCPTTSPPAEPLDLAAAAALEGVRGANPLVGAVITGPEGYVLAVGRHRGRGTAHAEVDAIVAWHAARAQDPAVAAIDAADLSLINICRCRRLW